MIYHGFAAATCILEANIVAQLYEYMQIAGDMILVDMSFVMLAVLSQRMQLYMLPVGAGFRKERIVSITSW